MSYDERKQIDFAKLEMGEWSVVLDLENNNLEFVPLNWLHAHLFYFPICKQGDGMNWNYLLFKEKKNPFGLKQFSLCESDRSLGIYNKMEELVAFFACLGSSNCQIKESGDLVKLN